jgi:hypothetical protein
MPDEQRDFFISFNGADEAYAKAISDALRAEGFTTFFHPDDLEFGGYIPKWMNDALLNSRRMLALCSPEYMDQGAIYSEAERYARVWQDTLGEKFKLVPVVLRDVDFPPLLAPYKRLIVTNTTPAQAAAAVVVALKKLGETKERVAARGVQPNEPKRLKTIAKRDNIASQLTPPMRPGAAAPYVIPGRDTATFTGREHEKALEGDLSKPIIFISYSHRDRPWLEYVRPFFTQLAKNVMLTIWEDGKLQIGDNWKGDIRATLDLCAILIVLVSRHSLSSSFVIDIEVAQILERRKETDVRLCPIVVTPCFMEGYDWLDDVNRRPPDGKALSELKGAKRDREMTYIIEQIAAITKELSAKAGQSIATVPGTAASSSTVPLPSIVDYTRLPEPSCFRLVGREAELRRLDICWDERRAAVVSLIGWGGSGKTALVNEWLSRLSNEGYRGAEAVLAWSFYSQGTRERSTSAEEFLNWILEKLGIALVTRSASAKADAIAEAMMRRRVLLVLDGVEPLQYGQDSQLGYLKDVGLRSLLRRFAATPSGPSCGLIVLNSRLVVKDITRWRDSAAPVMDIERLSDEAGAALLLDNAVWGDDEELKAAAHDFGGHPLALSLAASFLRETQMGDVRRRNRIRAHFSGLDSPGHDYARRVVECYEKELLADKPVLLAIMHIVGLFDRPASGDSIAALRAKPAINGLTDQVANLTNIEWEQAVARLRQVRLLAPRDPIKPDSLDAHPLVREWFGDRLQRTNTVAWKSAHGRLYEHLRDTTKEGITPTLEDLGPLYRAISHGCRAERFQETLRKIYMERICRREASGGLEFYSSVKLGATSSDLAVISWFFDAPYGVPSAALTETDRYWVLSQAAFLLQAQGRLSEALLAQRASLHISKSTAHWNYAAINAANLSETELLVGDISSAILHGAEAVAFADQSADAHLITTFEALRANALHLAGKKVDAYELFADAERRQRELRPSYPLLYSRQGYHYCDLLLARGDWTAARARVIDASKDDKQAPLLDRALNLLALGRADLGLMLTSDIAKRGVAIAQVRGVQTCLDQAVDMLRAAGAIDQILRGLLGRAIFRRSIGDWHAAARDLDEVEEIAEPGPMRLYLCDMAIGRARLALAKAEVFVPLNGLIDDSTPKPERPSEAARNILQNEATQQLAIAADYVEKCGYHRLDEELAELQAVQRGEKEIAELPPRV